MGVAIYYWWRKPPQDPGYSSEGAIKTGEKTQLKENKATNLIVKLTFFLSSIVFFNQIFVEPFHLMIIAFPFKESFLSRIILLIIIMI